MYKRSPLEKRLRRKGRGKVWCFTGYDYAGKRYEVSTKKVDRAEAIEAAREIERIRALPPAPAVTGPITGTLQQAYELLCAHDKRVNARKNTVEFHEDRAAHLLRVLGGACPLAAEHISVKVLNAYTDTRLINEKASRHTIQKEHRVLRQMIGLARTDGITTLDPATLKVQGFVNEGDFYAPGDRWIAEPAHVQVLLGELPADHADEVEVIVHTGLRRRELLTLTKARVDSIKCFLSVKAYKEVKLKTDGANRQVPLNKVACAILTRRCSSVKAGAPLFVEWENGNRDLAAAWARARAKIDPQGELELPEHLCFNDLRRTFCSLLKARGATFEQCAELLGHEDITMVRQVYGRTDVKALRSVVDLLV